MPTSSQTTADFISTLITMVKNLAEPAGIKDAASRYIYMNDAAHHYTNIPMSFDAEGRFDEEFPADWAEFAEDFKEHDRRTQNSKKVVSVIETHYWYNSDSLVPYIGEKTPIYNTAENCIGTLWTSRPFRALSPLIYIDQKKPSVLVTEFSDSIFTQCELNTLFLMLQRFSNKEIAKRMNVSNKTIENRIYTMYQKVGTHSFKQFESYCHHAGLDTYIPPSFTAKGVQFI